MLPQFAMVGRESDSSSAFVVLRRTAAKPLYAALGSDDALTRVAFIDLELLWKGRQAAAIRKSPLDLGGDPDVVITYAINEASERDEQFRVRSEGVAISAMYKREVRQDRY